MVLIDFQHELLQDIGIHFSNYIQLNIVMPIRRNENMVQVINIIDPLVQKS
jgi:hypothetical protein